MEWGVWGITEMVEGESLGKAWFIYRGEGDAQLVVLCPKLVCVGHLPSQGGYGFLKVSSKFMAMKGPVLPSCHVNASWYCRALHLLGHLLNDIGHFLQVYKIKDGGIWLKRLQGWRCQVRMIEVKYVCHQCPRPCICINWIEKGPFVTSSDTTYGLLDISLEEHVDKYLQHMLLRLLLL